MANILGDDSIDLNEGCKFMLYFFKYKIVFNMFYNEEKIHDCVIELKKNSIYAKTSNPCDPNEVLYPFTTQIQITIYETVCLH